MIKKGQSILEYAVLISILCAVFLVMFTYSKNAMRARLLVVQDTLNQANP